MRMMLGFAAVMLMFQVSNYSLTRINFEKTFCFFGVRVRVRVRRDLGQILMISHQSQEAVQCVA